MRTPVPFLFLAAAIAACGAPATKVIKGGGGDPLLPVAPALSLVTMTAMPSADLITADAPGKLAVRIRISAPPLADADRPPLNLALVLDTSASMEGMAIDALKAAAHEIVDHMSDRDTLTIVAFHSRAELLIESTALAGPGKARIDRAIDTIKATGTTDLAGGLALGLQQLVNHRVAGGIDRMVLLADGFPNDPAPIPGVVAQAAAQQIAITTLGIGSEPSEPMLAAIAKETGGVYRYAPTGTEIAVVFQKELLRMQTLVARNLILQIGPGPGIEIGDAPWLVANGRHRVVDLGDLAAGEVRDVIVPLAVPGHLAGLTVELLDADLRFTDALAGNPQTRSAFVGVKASDDAAAIKASVKADLVKAEARAAAAGAIIQAISLARAGSIDQARAMLATAEARARAAAKKLADDELTELADRMVELGPNLAQLKVQAQVIQPAPGGDGMPVVDQAMTMRPATAPAAVEPAIRDTMRKAQTTIDGR